MEFSGVMGRGSRPRTGDGGRGACLSALLVASVGIGVFAAVPASAASNPGAGDSGFFTFRPAEGVGGTQINVASGNALIRTQDLVDGPLTYHVVVDRAYNSLSPDGFTILSPRWGFDVGPDTKLTVEPNQDATVRGPSGYRIRFERQADGSYITPEGFDGTLIKTASGWTLSRTSQGDEFGFDGSGNLSWTKDSSLRDFTVQGTSAAGRTVLSSYGTSSGRRVNLSYDGDSLVRLMDDPASGHHSYRYTLGRLTEYESPTGAKTTYGYDANGFLDEIVEPGGTTVELDVSSSGKIDAITTTLPGGVPQTTSFVYTRRTYKSDVTAPDATRRTYAYDDDWRVTRQYDPDVVPTVAATGELHDLANKYTSGQQGLGVTVLATEPDGAGIDRLAVEKVGGGELGYALPACVTTPFDRVCPTSAAESFDAAVTSLPEGRHQLRAVARDDEGNVGGSVPWSIMIDRTPPPAATNFFVLQDPDDETSLSVGWGNDDDPRLADGVAGSGLVSWSFRSRKSGTTAWSPWTTEHDFDGRIANADFLSSYDVEVITHDGAGNSSAVASGTVTYVDEATLTAGFPPFVRDDESEDIVEITPDDEALAFAPDSPAGEAVVSSAAAAPIQRCKGVSVKDKTIFTLRTTKSPAVAWSYQIQPVVATPLGANFPALLLRYKSDLYVNGASRSQGGPNKPAESPFYVFHGSLRSYSRGSRPKRVPLKAGDRIRFKLSISGDSYNPTTRARVRVRTNVDTECQIKQADIDEAS